VAFVTEALKIGEGVAAAVLPGALVVYDGGLTQSPFGTAAHA
jgi:hypothetical protein